MNVYAMETRERFKINAVWNGEYYNNFGISSVLAHLYSKCDLDIEKITMQVSDNQDIPNGNDLTNDNDYWGWFDFEHKEFSNMIFNGYFLLNMCFPSGMSNAEKSGKGKAYRLEVVESKH